VREKEKPLTSLTSPTGPSNPLTGAELADHFASRLFDKLGLQGQATMHGFRSSFRTWAAKEAGADHVVADLALGHTVGTGFERLPVRGSLAPSRSADGALVEFPHRPGERRGCAVQAQSPRLSRVQFSEQLFRLPNL
jgi:hypothetical protein